ncbi:MAG TPA: ATP-binding protein [Polyangiaceae bacterium]|nr:ATP-binding protein [Polyangiaceae bacterium]
MSILVLTPDADAAHTLCAALTRSGQQVSWAPDLEQAEASVRHEPPLVLVADTEVDAHARLIAELRLASPWARVLRIGESAPTSDRAGESDGSHLIPKPFDASELAALLTREQELASLERSRHDLHERVAGLTLLVDECFEAIVGLSRDGIVESWNPGAATLYGYEPHEIIGQSLTLLDAEPTRIKDHLRPSEQRVREVRRRHKSGREILVLASVSRVTQGRSANIELLEVSLDVTERRELERGLEHAERLAAIGRIAAGMAHEINNPLAVIRASAACIAEIAERAGDTELIACASDIDLAVERIGSFVQHVCGFARRERPQMTDAPIQTAIDIALRMVRPRVKDRRVELIVEPSANINVPHDPPRLAQAILNVLSNAVDAAASGGKHVTLRTRIDDDSLRIEVDDDGPGLSPELALTAFEPFKTTKPFGQGTGLGLSITRQIATDHGGCVKLEPREGGGARVGLELPRFRASVYRLLVLDDDPAVRRALASDLRREGFDVLTADSLGEARDLLRRNPIQVVLSDWQLPDAGGPELIQALQRESRATRIIVTSADPSLTASEGVERVLNKPWTRDTLTQLVRSVCLKGERRSQPPPVAAGDE